MFRSIAASTNQNGSLVRIASIVPTFRFRHTQLHQVKKLGRHSMTVSLSTCSSTNHYSHQQHDGSFGWSPIIGLGLMATVAAATTSTTSTMMRGRCDAAEEVVEDPYDNLPEKDEPTHCSICLTYRQGPCRPYWRKVEACTKDNELPERKEGEKDDADDDDDNAENNPDPPCLKYMMPWIDCASGYRNLYALIEMDTNYTEGIQDLESTSKGFCWAPGKEPKVDWQPWQDYVELLNPEWKVPRSSPKNDQQEQQQRQHFWKSLDHSEDPEIVQVEATVATTMVGGGVLECAYAVDQNGDVIGFAYGTKPSEAAKGEIKETSETTTMTIRLVPSRTRQVVLAAAYTYVVDDSKKKKPTTSSEKSDDDAVESHVYKSRPFHLVMVADRKTKINIARGAA